MYGGLDKYGGDIVGEFSNKKGLSGQEAFETSGAEETLVGQTTLSDGSTKEVMLSATIDAQFGGLKWAPVENASDTYKGVVSMSQMTSMLHDADRNRKYESAISAAVTKFTENEGRPPIVLDIGTGTGLLAMMAARAGASKVYACEMFPTMAEIATEVTRQNCGDKIKVIAKCSTDLTVGENGDMAEKADILVTEIFDSILLGEAVLPTIRHALRELLRPDPIIVPESAKVFGQVVHCPQVRQMSDLSEVEFWPGKKLSRSDDVCRWIPPAFPLHMSALDPQPVNLSNVIEFESFNFNTPFGEGETKSRLENVPATTSGSADGFCLYWELKLWDDTFYSTEAEKENWQDHWLQAIIPFARAVKVAEGNPIPLRLGHTELNLFVQILAGESGLTTESTNQNHAADEEKQAAKKAKTGDFDSQEPCSCGFHLLCSSERIAQLGDSVRTENFKAAITKVLGDHAGRKVCLDVGDGSFLSLIAAAAGAGGALSLEKKAMSNMLFSQIANHHNLESMNIWEGGEDWPFLTQTEQGLAPILADILIGEPYYYQMQNLILWQAINFWYLRTLYRVVLKENPIIVPQAGVVYGMVVELPELHLSHGRVGDVCGFDHSHLDTVQDGWHENLFPYPMWQYTFKALSKQIPLITFQYSEEITDVSSEAFLPIVHEGTFHAVMIWVEYNLTDGIVVSTFPTKDQRSCKQMLKFAAQPVQCTSFQEGEPCSSPKAIKATSFFSSASGKLMFDFGLCS